MSDLFTKKIFQPESVSDLLEKHHDVVHSVLREAQKQVQASSDEKLHQASEQAPLDEIFVLRFVLSSKQQKNVALQRIMKTLEWRSQRLEDLRAAQNGDIKHLQTMKKYNKTGIIGYLNDLHPVYLVRAGESNTRGTLSELTAEQVFENMVLWNEAVYHMCDKRTRKTGLLCKQIMIIDLGGFSVTRFDPRVSVVLAQSSHLSSTIYPQLLGKCVILNMPIAFRLIYKAISKLLPQSTKEKQAICPGNISSGSPSSCPFLNKLPTSLDILPKFLGGRADLPEHLLLDREAPPSSESKIQDPFKDEDESEIFYDALCA